MSVLNILGIVFLLLLSSMPLSSFASTQGKIDPMNNGEAMSVREGYIQFHGYKTWYRIVGTDKYPEKSVSLPSRGAWSSA